MRGSAGDREAPARWTCRASHRGDKGTPCRSPRHSRRESSRLLQEPQGPNALCRLPKERSAHGEWRCRVRRTPRCQSPDEGKQRLLAPRTRRGDATHTGFPEGWALGRIGPCDHQPASLDSPKDVMKSIIPGPRPTLLIAIRGGSDPGRDAPVRPNEALNAILPPVAASGLRFGHR